MQAIDDADAGGGGAFHFHQVGQLPGWHCGCLLRHHYLFVDNSERLKEAKESFSSAVLLSAHVRLQGRASVGLLQLLILRNTQMALTNFSISALKPREKPRLHVPVIGGPHHFAHFLPVAFELARRGSADVALFVSTAQDFRDVVALAQELGAPLPRTIIMDLPAAISRFLPSRLEKITRLLAWISQLRNCDAILCAERTSTILKRIPGRCPKLIHIPHGAGDRAIGFEPRFRLFDAVLVAGPKDRDRLLAKKVVNADTCAVSGPIKVAAILEAHKSRKPLFSNDRPVLLYNPHFSRTLSSGEVFAHRLADTVKHDGRYNLVIAPHIRMAQNWSKQRRNEWQALAVDDRILVDLGSSRSVDMTYTLGADVYIGDVSSQVYEFLVRPRPCLFVNAHDAVWGDNEDYAMWRFGEVVSPDCDIPAAIERAFDQHEKFRTIQIARTRAALHGLDWNASGEPVFLGQNPINRGADIVEACLVQASPCKYTKAGSDKELELHEPR